MILFALIAFVVLIGAIFIPCAGWLIGPGVFIFLSLVVGPLLAPIVILEQQGSGTSLRRAWDLGRSRFWWLLGFALVLALLSQLIITAPSYLIRTLLQSMLAGQGSYINMLVWSSVIQTLVQMLGGLLYLPLQLCAMMVVYFDLRVRTEGLDLAMQAAANAGAETNIVALTGTSPKPSPSLVTGSEVGQFILVSIATVAIYAILIGILMAVTLALASAFQ